MGYARNFCRAPLGRGARQKYGSNSTYFRGTPLFVAYYRDQISRIYASSTAALVQNLAVFALEKIGKSSRSLSIGILKNSKKRNDSRHGTNHFNQGPPNALHKTELLYRILAKSRKLAPFWCSYPLRHNPTGEVEK